MANSNPKGKRAKIMLPAGIAVYPRVNQPNQFGNYELTIRYPNADVIREVVELIEEVDEAYRTVMGALGKDLPETTHFPIKTEEDGTVTIKAKLKAAFTPKDSAPIPQSVLLIDSQKLPVTEIITGGSTVKAAVTARPTYMPSEDGPKMYVSLDLRAVQVLELAERGIEAADEFGLEDGFTAAVEADKDGGDF